MDKKGYAFGVDLGGTKIQILKIDSKGKVLGSLKIPTDVKKGAPYIINSLIKALKSMSHEPPLGVGVGVAGQIEEESGTVLFGPNLKWKDVLLAEQIKKGLKTEVFVTNDVRAATIGELVYGAAQGVSHLLSIFVGTGIGGSIVIDGQVLKGPNNTAGEIGHMVVDLNGPPCTCGSKGCLEAIASGWGMEARAMTAVNADPIKAKTLIALAMGDPSAIKGPMIQQAAKNKDPLALSIVKEAEKALIFGTKSLVNILNPKVIVFGGGIIDANPDMVERIEKGVQKNALKAAVKNVEFRISALKGEAGSFGAAAIVFRALGVKN